MKTIIVFLALGVGIAEPAQAQDRLPLGTRVGSAAAASGYESGGRRDPFVSLLVSRKAPVAATSRPSAGLAGLVIADVSVKGIIHSGSATLAVLEGPGGRSFIARIKDRLQNAVVKSIDADGVVFAEQVVDDIGAMHSRDVRKTLRAAAEGTR